MKKYYGSINGLRTAACIGIVMMHVASNSNYSLDGFLSESVIPSFTNFVFLFMAVSAFGMCCGYYEKNFFFGFLWETVQKDSSLFWNPCPSGCDNVAVRGGCL